jgi:hypothetical protein
LRRPATEIELVSFYEGDVTANGTDGVVLSDESIETITDAEDLVGEDAKLGKTAARVSTTLNGR